VSVGAIPIASRIVIRGPVADARFLIRCDSPPVDKTTRIQKTPLGFAVVGIREASECVRGSPTARCKDLPH